MLADCSSVQEWRSCLSTAAAHQLSIPLALLQRLDSFFAVKPDALAALSGWETVLPAYLSAKHWPAAQTLAAITGQVRAVLLLPTASWAKQHWRSWFCCR